jgi:hypothetical protein
LPKHTARIVQAWFEENEHALWHLPWPAKSSDLSIIEPLWSILESRVGSRFPPPSSLKRLESVFSWRVEQYCTMDYSELTYVCSKQDMSCITDKWQPNATLIKQCHSQLFPILCTFFLNVMPCSLVKMNWHLRDLSCLQHEG